MEKIYIKGSLHLLNLSTNDETVKQFHPSLFLALLERVLLTNKPINYGHQNEIYRWKLWLTISNINMPWGGINSPPLQWEYSDYSMPSIYLRLQHCLWHLRHLNYPLLRNFLEFKDIWNRVKQKFYIYVFKINDLDIYAGFPLLSLTND